MWLQKSPHFFVDLERMLGEVPIPPMLLRHFWLLLLPFVHEAVKLVGRVVGTKEDNDRLGARHLYQLLQPSLCLGHQIHSVCIDGGDLPAMPSALSRLAMAPSNAAPAWVFAGQLLHLDR